MGECTNPGEEMNYALFGTCAGLLLYRWDGVAALRDPGTLAVASVSEGETDLVSSPSPHPTSFRLWSLWNLRGRP